MKQETEFLEITESEYSEILNTAITQINTARNALATQVNTTVISTYWNLGKLLHDKKIESGYGTQIVERLSIDLKSEFTEMGLSPRNLWYMKKFYERYYKSEKLQRCVAVLSWRKNIILLDKKLSDEEIFYYATESIMNMYLSLLDKLEKEDRENQSIGIILCAEKDHLDVELALQDIHKPIAVSDYELIVPRKELQTMILNEIKQAEIEFLANKSIEEK